MRYTLPRRTSPTAPGQVDPGSAGNSSTGQVGWIKENNRWWFRYPDGSFPKNSWQYISDQWYLFDKDGWMLTGWQQVNGQYFYLNEGGNMATGWLNWNNRWYYLNPVSDGNRGMMIKGWYTINGYQYCFGADGVCWRAGTRWTATGTISIREPATRRSTPI